MREEDGPRNPTHSLDSWPKGGGALLCAAQVCVVVSSCPFFVRKKKKPMGLRLVQGAGPIRVADTACGRRRCTEKCGQPQMAQSVPLLAPSPRQVGRAGL